MTRPAPAPRMRIVPEVATEEMGSAAGRLYDRCAIENYGAPPDAEDVYDAMLDAAPNAGCVSREMVERMARALCAQNLRRDLWNTFGQMADKANFTAFVERYWTESIPDAEIAIAALGLTVAPAADTARNGEAG